MKQTILNTYKVLAYPTSYNITLTQAKDWLQVTHTRHDDMINTLISASLEHTTDELGFPLGDWVLETGPKATQWATKVADFYITGSVAVYSGSTTVPTGDYVVVEQLDGTWVYFSALPQEPELQYAFTSSAVEPSAVRLARLKWVVDNYEARGSQLPTSLTETGTSYGRLLNNYRNWKV